jgi:beta-phosphoglucomutase-like phosphatase (HAD superfamily)
MGVDPSNCLVIEDSASGVTAGIAAGMTVIGLTAASHIQPGHRKTLFSAGAQYVANSFGEVEEITNQFLKRPFL